MPAKATAAAPTPRKAAPAPQPDSDEQDDGDGDVQLNDEAEIDDGEEVDDGEEHGDEQMEDEDNDGAEQGEGEEPNAEKEQEDEEEAPAPAPVKQRKQQPAAAAAAAPAAKPSKAAPPGAAPSIKKAASFALAPAAAPAAAATAKASKKRKETAEPGNEDEEADESATPPSKKQHSASGAAVASCSSSSASAATPSVDSERKRSKKKKHKKCKDPKPDVDEAVGDSSTPSKRARIIHPLNTNVSISKGLNWSVNRALRELLLNATDQDPATTVSQTEVDGEWVIHNLTARHPLSLKHFVYATDDDNVSSTSSHGKFGYGLKDAVVVLRNFGLGYRAHSCNGKFTTARDADGGVNIVVTDDVDPEVAEAGTKQFVYRLAKADRTDLLSAKELKKEVKKAKYQCLHFRKLEQAGMEKLDVHDKDGNLLGSIYLPVETKLDHDDFAGQDELFVHSLALPFSYTSEDSCAKKKAEHRKEIGCRPQLAFVYNLAMDKSHIQGRDRINLPKSWDSALAQLIRNADERVLLYLSKLSHRKFYEVEHGKIMKYINRFLKAKENETRQIQATAKAALEREEAAKRELDARNEELRCLEAERQQEEEEEDDDEPPAARAVARQVLVKAQNMVAEATKAYKQCQVTAQQSQAAAARMPAVTRPRVHTRRDVAADVPTEAEKRALSLHAIVGNKQGNNWDEAPVLEEYRLMLAGRIPHASFLLFRRVRRLLLLLGVESLVQVHAARHADSLLAFDAKSSILFIEWSNPLAVDAHTFTAQVLRLLWCNNVIPSLRGYTEAEALALLAAQVQDVLTDDSHELLSMKRVPELRAWCQTDRSPAASASEPSFCPLLVATEWDTKQGGISSFNMQFALGLAGVLKPRGGRVYVAVLACESGVTSSERKERDEAQQAGVYVVDVTLCRGQYTPVLTSGECALVTHIVGHAHITGEQAATMRLLPQLRHTKVWQINHVLPKEVDVLKEFGSLEHRFQHAMPKEQTLLALNKAADRVLSVGKLMFEHFEDELRDQGNLHPPHTPLVLPLHPDFVVQPTTKVDFNRPVHVLYFGRVDNVIFVKGLDIAWAACANAQHQNEAMRNVAFRVVGTPAGKEAASHHKLSAELSPHLRNIAPDFRSFASPQQVRDHLQWADVVLMPSRMEPFGLVAMEAIACGVPVLITSNSGVADLLHEKAPGLSSGMVVKTSRYHPTDKPDFKQADVKDWTDALVKLVHSNRAAFINAKQLREQLLQDLTAPYDELVNFGTAEL